MVAEGVLTPEQLQQLKQLVATTAVRAHAQSNTVIVLGTGSTAECAVRELGTMVKEGGLRGVRFVATSVATETLARSLGLELIDIDQVTREGLKISVAFDGADEVNEKGQLVKGRGAALFREKFTESMAETLVIMVDETKMVPRLGVTGAIPLEVVSFGKETTRARVLSTLKTHFPHIPEIRAEFRMNHVTNQLIYTDNGNLILDLFIDHDRQQRCFEREWDEVNDLLLQTIGVIETGLFIALNPKVYVARLDQSNNTASVTLEEQTTNE